MERVWRGRIAAALALLLGGLSPVAQAEHTRRWRQSSYEEFVRGTAHGVALRSDGRLVLAPRFAAFADADASYLWALRADSKGNLYAAGGSDAKVFRFDARGKAATVFESAELSAQALAVDAQDNLYIGTSPDGKVYKVTPRGEKSVFFEPKTKYIWDLVFGPGGILYVATGDKGQIFAVTPDGKSEVFYAGEETHIRAIVLDGKGNLVAGTEPSGQVLRIPLAATPAAKNAAQKKGEQPPARRAFVLYETEKKEVTALAVDDAGNLYAAAIGEKQRPAKAAPVFPVVTPQAAPPPGAGANIAVAPAVGPQAGVFVPFPPAISSAVYRIGADGAPEELWNSREELVYALGFSAQGRLLLGTGGDGAIVEIESRGISSRLAKAGSAQVTGFARSADGKLFLCTANPGKVFSLGPDYEAEGTFESQTFDAQLFSEWGRLEWWGEGAPSGNAGSERNARPRVSFYVRSGNTADPGKEWSDWFGPYTATGGEKAGCPAARFIQWKAVIRDGRAGDGIDWVSVAYLPRNVAPVMDAIVLQNPGVRAQGIAAMTGGAPAQQPVALKFPPAPGAASTAFAPAGAAAAAQAEKAPVRFDAPPQGFVQKGYRTVLWSAHDDNDDELRYAIYYRGEAEREWKLLKDKIEQKFYSWDTTTMPDGAYYLKIVATDAPSNPPNEALATERVSDRFEVDNTPPAVEKLTASDAASSAGSPRSHGTFVQFEASDAASAIERAEYSLDAGDWTIVLPEGRLSDARREQYQITLTELPPGEHTVAVRVYDRFENLSSAKITFVTSADTR